MNDTDEVDFDALNKEFAAGLAGPLRPAQCARAIEQIIQDVLKVTAINTSLAEKQLHHDVHRYEVIHTAGKRLQQED